MFPLFPGRLLDATHDEVDSADDCVSTALYHHFERNIASLPSLAPDSTLRIPLDLSLHPAARALQHSCSLDSALTNDPVLQLQPLQASLNASCETR